MDDDDVPAGMVEVDAITALGTMLSRVDGRVQTLADLAAGGPLLVAVVERSCDTATASLPALTSAGCRLAVVSQGRPEAARHLVHELGGEPPDVLVEPAPHPVSEALAATVVPTFVLFEDLDITGHLDGWDRPLLARLVARAGGRLAGDVPSARPDCPSRTTLDELGQASREAADASLWGQRPAASDG